MPAKRSSDMSGRRLAEREGFEPPSRRIGKRLSRPPHSTALPSLLKKRPNLILLCQLSRIDLLFRTLAKKVFRMDWHLASSTPPLTIAR